MDEVVVVIHLPLSIAALVVVIVGISCLVVGGRGQGPLLPQS